MALSFIPEIWNAGILSALHKSLVYGGLVNRDYEGQIRAGGDTVRIRSVGRPTISSYSKYGTLTYDQLTDAQRSLVVDQQKSFSFVVDDIDQVQTAGGEIEEATAEAGYALADTLDQFLAALYTGIQSDNQVGTVSVTSAALAYTQLRKLNQKLNEANVPTDGRWVVVPPWYEGLLLEDDRFVRVDASGTSEGLRNGQIGRALGFDVMVSNNAPLVTGDDYAVIAGRNSAITLAEQIVKTETVELQTTFGTGVRGLHVYGAKLVRPDSLASVYASIT